jgi:thymidylate synthase
MLLRDGDIVEGRGGAAKEIMDFALVLEDPRACIVGRHGFSEAFMHLEIAMLLAGTYDYEKVQGVLPRAADLVTPLTAYGPRVQGQIPLIIKELRKNPQSRRALVYVGKHDDLYLARGMETAGEMPCTALWQFLIRDDKLHMIVYMRSWDAVWGLSYDVPCFVAMQMAIARDLTVGLGTYRHHAGSFHIYDRHWDITTNPCHMLLNCDLIGDTFQITVRNALRQLA